MKWKSAAVLLVLAGLASAQTDATVTLHVKDRDLTAVAHLLAGFSSTKVEADPALAERKITLDLDSVPLTPALEAVAREAHGEVLELGPGRVRIVEREDAWEERIRKALDGEPLDLSFQDAPIDNALAFLSRISGVPIVLDPAVRKGRAADELIVTIGANQITPKDALQLMSAIKGLAWDVRWGVVFLSTPGRLQALPRTFPWKEHMGLREAMLRRYSLRFEAIPIRTVLESLRKTADAPIRFVPARGKPVDAACTVSFEDLPLRHVLPLLLFAHGVPFHLTDEAVIVEILRGAATDWAARLSQELDTTRVKLDVTEQPLSTVLGTLAHLVGAPVVLDPGAGIGGGTPVSFQADSEPARRVLERLTGARGLTFDLRFHAVFLSTKERLASLPRTLLPPEEAGAPAWEARLRRDLGEKRLSFSFATTTISDAVGFLRRVGRVNIVFDPEARAAAAKSSLTLEARDIPLGDALALLLLPRGFDCVLESEVVLIRQRK